MATFNFSGSGVDFTAEAYSTAGSTTIAVGDIYTYEVLENTSSRISITGDPNQTMLL